MSTEKANAERGKGQRASELDFLIPRIDSMEQRIFRTEGDMRSISERLTRLEEQQQQRHTDKEHRFNILLTLFAVIVAAILSAIVGYLLGSLGRP